MTVNKEHIELFAQALESGDNKQCRGRLRLRDIGKGDIYYCALGIATKVALDNGLKELMIQRYGVCGDDVAWVMPNVCDEVADWYGWDKEVEGRNDPVLAEDEDGNMESIAGLNDAGWDFWQIAQAARTKWLKDEG